MTTSAYLAVAVAGAWSLIHTPVSYSDTLPSWVTWLWSLSLIAGGLLCAIGVAAGMWRVEWIASWVLSFGVAVYAVLSWSVTLDSPASGTRALILTAMTGIILARALLLSRMDRMARERRQAETYVEDGV